jgi:ornithine decarboxylase
MKLFIYLKQDVEKDPFYIVDLEDICNKHINWITRLPRVEPHYAIKCNTDIMLLKLLAFLGCGFDCASKNEIQKVLDLGVSPDRIIFANPCKQTSYIKYAHKQGVNYMTFDNEMELYKIKENHPNAKCVLRIITNDANAVCRFSMKFGADMESSLRLIEVAHKLELDLAGVSFHVGSGQMSPEAFSESIQNARKLFDYAREEFGIRMHMLDLGGGYPGSSDSIDLFDAISKEINMALEEHFPQDFFAQLNEDLGDDGKFRIIAEPGRYYACSAFTLCVNVISRRDMIQTEEQQEQDKKITNDSASSIDHSKSIMYYINDGVYASFNCLFYDHAEVQPVLIDESRNEDLSGFTLYKSSVWGPTCDGLDLVVKETYLPELKLNEFLVFKNMGAYTLSGAVPFNGIPLARCIYVVSNSWDTIKNAFETEEEENDAIIPVDQQLVMNLLKEAANNPSSNICAALSRALTSMQQQQAQQMLMQNELENDLGELVLNNRCSASDELNDIDDKKNTGCLDQSTIDMAISC